MYLSAGTVAESVAVGLASGSIYALIASGLTLTYSVTRHFNFAHGDFLAVAMYICYSLYASFKLDPYLSLVIVVPLMFILGLIVFRVFLRPLLPAGPITSLIALFGISQIIEYSLSITSTAQPHKAATFLDLHKLSFGPLALTYPRIVALIASLIISLGFYWLLKKTDFGRAIRAVAEKPEYAALMGINVRKVQMLVFGLGFVLLAIAGVAYTPMIQIVPFMGLQITLFVFIVLTLGGMGNFLGALVAGLIIGVTEALSSLFWGVGLSAAIPYALFIAVMLFKPKGLFGSKA